MLVLLNSGKRKHVALQAMYQQVLCAYEVLSTQKCILRSVRPFTPANDCAYYEELYLLLGQAKIC